MVTRLTLHVGETAELLVVNKLSDERVVAANGAVEVTPHLHLTELHAQGIKQQEAARKGLTQAQNQLDGFHCLDGANDSGQDSQDAGFSAAGDGPRRGRTKR